MEPLLAQALKGLAQRSRSIARWGEGRLHLRVSGYLTDSVPPPQYVTSARCLVLQSSKVLVQRDRSGAHVLPGGRIEPGEAPEAAMRREVLEETGWRLGPAQFLGFMRFRHLSPRPADYVYPYPDFIQLVYTAEARFGGSGQDRGRLGDWFRVSGGRRDCTETASQPGSGYS